MTFPMDLVPLELGATITFWVCSLIAVICSIAMVFAKKAVHAALYLATVMIALAALYAALDAPFLFVVQIIVYTGAILMLFLFVVMLVGVDVRESFKETIKGQRVLSIVGVVALAGLLITILAQVFSGTQPMGLAKANAAHGGNVEGLANILFSTYVLAFELTSALLITGVVGAMVLAHLERSGKKPTQADLQKDRIKRYGEVGEHPGARPSSGVYARSNSVAAPALLPDGTIAESSVSQVLTDRGAQEDPAALTAATKQVYAGIDSVQRGELEK